MPKAPKDRRLRIPSKSIHNVKEQERKPTSGKKVTGCELPRANFYCPSVGLSNANIQFAELYSKTPQNTTDPSPPGPDFGARNRLLLVPGLCLSRASAMGYCGARQRIHHSDVIGRAPFVTPLIENLYYNHGIGQDIFMSKSRANGLIRDDEFAATTNR